MNLPRRYTMCVCGALPSRASRRNNRSADSRQTDAEQEGGGLPRDVFLRALLMSPHGPTLDVKVAFKIVDSGSTTPTERPGCGGNIAWMYNFQSSCACKWAYASRPDMHTRALRECRFQPPVLLDVAPTSRTSLTCTSRTTCPKRRTLPTMGTMLAHPRPSADPRRSPLLLKMPNASTLAERTEFIGSSPRPSGGTSASVHDCSVRLEAGRCGPLLWRRADLFAAGFVAPRCPEYNCEKPGWLPSPHGPASASGSSELRRAH